MLNCVLFFLFKFSIMIILLGKERADPNASHAFISVEQIQRVFGDKLGIIFEISP